MAKYNRDFLVPYLRDLCALHLALRKVDQRYDGLRRQIQRLKNGVYQATLPKKYWSEPMPMSGILGASVGCVAILLSFLLFSLGVGALGWMFMIFGIMDAAFGISKIVSVVNSNNDSQARYESEYASYRSVQKKNEEERNKKLPYLQSEVERCLQEERCIRAALQNAYNVNIIPGHYRDTYAAVFLYDWFSTGRSDDLDMALSMYVLEEIKDRLDQVIMNQSDIILNQCLMIAEQRKSMEMQQEYSAMLTQKLERLEASNDERNVYLGMIESNTATTAYFAQADYIRSI